MKATILHTAVVLAMLFAPARLCADADAATGEGTFIDTVGRYTPATGLEVEVFVLGEQFFNYKVTFERRRSAGPTVAAYRKELPWFFYAASSAEVWFYDGAESVLRIRFTKGATQFTDNYAVPELVRAAPPVVRDRLPERLRR